MSLAALRARPTPPLPTHKTCGPGATEWAYLGGRADKEPGKEDVPDSRTSVGSHYGPREAFSWARPILKRPSQYIFDLGVFS